MAKAKIAVIIFIILIFLIILGDLIYIYSIKSCSPGEKKCDGSQVLTCSSDGKSFSITENCSIGCFNGECRQSCSSCNIIGKLCGTFDNKCGGQINCGTCSQNQLCQSGLCVNKQDCIPNSCFDLGNTCGYSFDGCGNTINCGTCPSNYSCSDGKCQLMNPSQLPKFSDSYETERKSSGISDEYLKETFYYDYSKQNLQVYISLIKLEGNFDAKNSAKSIGKLVYEKVKYDLKAQTAEYCYNNSASSVLANGFGVCGTMSRVDVAILRGLGLASREIVGCMKQSFGCSSIQNVIGNNPLAPIKKQGKKYILGGELHGWVEVWLPETGWTILESTNGQLYPDSCTQYDVYAREQDFNQDIDECGMINETAQKCLAW